MSLLVCGEIRPDAVAPNLGPALMAHLARKANPEVAAASRTAWSLLAVGLERLGVHQPSAVAFDPSGKPHFEGGGLHFSLSHSGHLAAALLCPAPCGVDVEQVRTDVAARLAERCLSPRERALGCDFFEAWTRKECIAKLDGRGMTAHPDGIDTLDPLYAGRFRSLSLTDKRGQRYVLSLLCDSPDAVEIVQI